MKYWKKILILSVVIAIVMVSFVYYYIFIYSKNNHRNVANEKGIVATAVQLLNDYTNNEDSANKKYLDKTIEVTGEVASVKQDSLISVTLKTNNVFSSVYCTLQGNQPKPDSGKIVTIKGICTGKLSDVVLKDAIIQNK
jgi:uncharacterized membrane protein